jgi:hypothetical protein
MAPVLWQEGGIVGARPYFLEAIRRLERNEAAAFARISGRANDATDVFH